jgi:CHAD domain-containing protein
VGQPVELMLEAVYFDTARLDLARHGITLRRRTGGDDAGWHLKLPAGKDTRSEVRLPLGAATKTVPPKLLAPVRAVVRDRPLAPVAQVTTRRLQYDILDANAVVLGQLCDDEVHAERLQGTSRVEDWREWEIELVDGTQQLLDAVEARLLAVGASPSTTGSKLLRALGEDLPRPRERPSREELSRGTVAQLLLAHLAAHTEELQTQDRRLRDDEPGSVHKLRIATRRLRSAVKTYRRLFASGSADTADLVGVELRWLGQVLSKARDAQVMRERLDLLVASEPAELVLGPVSQRIDNDLSAEYRAGREQALEAVNSERYFRLLDALDELGRFPSLTRKSDRPAKEVLPRLLRRDAKRLRRAVAEITSAADRHQRDLALHEARKKAKRVRYAAESAVPVFPGEAKKLATSAKRVQRALGEHQDSVVARGKLREYGAQTHLSGENGFTFGRLHGLEQARAENAEREFEAAWRRTEKELARWIGHK